MNTIKRFTSTLFGACVLMALPVVAAAYEVNILDGNGAEAKALNNGEYELAIERLERRLLYGNRDRDIRLTNLCTAYVVTGEYEKATKVCDEAVEENGDYVGVAFNSRGVLNAMLGDYISALADFEQAGKKSNYPVVRRQFADNAPSMRRFGTPDMDVESSMRIAAYNSTAAEQVFYAQREE
jgi:tetratricopeptide (TPR) repeat protein